MYVLAKHFPHPPPSHHHTQLFLCLIKNFEDLRLLSADL